MQFQSVAILAQAILAQGFLLGLIRSRIFLVHVMRRGRTWQFNEELSHVAWVRILRSSTTISPVAQSRSAARASDWHAPEWWTVAAAAEASPGRDPSGPSSRAKFQASRGVRCCNAGEDSTVGGNSRRS